ncbi:hypothetical protein IW136_001082 [Coemansia sp. RSA 678]|nr:hypothetical protein IW136_001082 [Coemansia sp. RSA 678]
MAHRFEDMLTILEHEPCAREGLLYGVGAGGAAAFLGLFKRGSLITAGNWGFLTFGVVAIASKQVCHYYQAQRRARNRLRLGIRPDGSLINVKNFKPDSTNVQNFKPDGANVQNFKPDSPAGDKPGNSD